ncbi:hypothetical protein NUW58_g4946 [Xylaria curta]|uniref:Uncharacterized protein n=1 Tax=Xylaria curta TaxID=42375 RepID=A0ACC1P6T0_9PEZI|nr:hypothetical protein NUW58_g4946 [Xylaria curta]
MANAVSFVTRSTSLALRISTAVGGYGIGAAKITTLSSLELGRHILDGILNRAGRDALVGSPSELARADAESILEMSLESMHQAMSQFVFWTAAGFHTAETAVSAASQVSQLFLSTLDQFFGSTDSSRAIASIITLVRREFRNPATGMKGERVGVMDLVLGLCGLAYLQARCRRMMQEESRRLGHEEVIWDVIVLNDGERIDALHGGIRNGNKAHSADSSHVNDAARVIEHRSFRRNSTDDDDDARLEAQLRKHVAKSLPKDAKICITTSTTTTKTITVDVTGASGASIPSFPNLDLVQSEVSHPHQPSRGGQGQASNYQIVYEVSRHTVRNTPEDRHEVEIRPSIEEPDSDDDGQSVSSVSPSDQKSNDSPPIPTVTRSAVAYSTKGRSSNLSRGHTHQAKSVSEGPSNNKNGSPKVSFTTWTTDRNERAANQKKTRAPLDALRKTSKDMAFQIPSDDSRSHSRRLLLKPDSNLVKRGEKQSRSAPKKGSAPTFANCLSRESSSDSITGTQSKLNAKRARSSPKSSQTRTSSVVPKTPVPNRTSSAILHRAAPRTPQRGNLNYSSPGDISFLASRSYVPPAVPVRNRRQSSLVSLTDTLSIRSYESRSPSPTGQDEPSMNSGHPSQKRTHETELSTPPPQRIRPQTAPQAPRAYTPSIYTLDDHGSRTSLVVPSMLSKSAYGDAMALDSLRQSGGVKGMFPEFHFLRNITRYSRYSSAVYGRNFLRVMGISKDRPTNNISDETHYDVRSFAHHTKLPPDSILLASFVDPQGGSDSTGATDTGIPLVHTIALDEESKAVVLTCRGTLGFEDVLADMMCEYDDLIWKGKTYKVHKGIHASARRLMYGGDGRVLFTIKAALEEYPGYGLVLCGHSLGGAVTALLGVMLAEPSSSGAGFLTSAAEHPKLLSDGGLSETPTYISLPPGRPIHVYAYGPPATMSPSLQKATRGLITSTVHGNDMVPYLSLGVLHDFQALALSFKADNNEAKAEVKRRVWDGLRSGLADRWYNNSTKQSNEDEETWACVAFKTLRVSMMSSKLLPPGEVFKIQTTPVMRRDAFTQENSEDIGRPATRIVLKYIRDVEAHFRTVRFGSSMLMDHSPGRYEDALRRLTLGVVEI